GCALEHERQSGESRAERQLRRYQRHRRNGERAEMTATIANEQRDAGDDQQGAKEPEGGGEGGHRGPSSAASRHLLPREKAVGEQASRHLVPVGERSEEHTSELQSRENLVCRLLPE